MLKVIKNLVSDSVQLNSATVHFSIALDTKPCLVVCNLGHGPSPSASRMMLKWLSYILNCIVNYTANVG